MGRLDNLPEYVGSENESDDPKAAEQILRAVTQDLRNLQQDLVTQLNQDIRRLQAEKSRLVNDVEKLQSQQQALQSQYEVSLSHQQLAQQQAWAKQLALVLANHLQTALSERLSQTMSAQPLQGPINLPQISAASRDSDGAYRLLSSLDDTVNRTFDSLRHDINSYQSSLAQQLDRMHAMGQQGEAILEVLVSRLSQQLQAEAGRSPANNRVQTGAHASANFSAPMEATPVGYPRVEPTPSRAESMPLSETVSSRTEPVRPPASTATLREPSIAPEPDVTGRPPRSKKQSQFQLGLAMILLSTVALALHSVLVGVVGNPSKLFGELPLGGYIKLDTFSSGLLLLWVRMLVVVPLMAWLAALLHKPTWREIRTFSQSKDRRLLLSVIGSGFFLFLSQALIYVAIAQIGPGVAVTILFVYPAVTVPLTWLLFGDRPSSLRFGVVFAALVGAVLAAYPLLSNAADGTERGLVAAILAGVTFACYLMSMQLISYRKIHPVPVSLLQFATMFVLTSLSLITIGIKVGPSDRFGLVISGIALGALTIGSYLLNNFGARLMGVARAAIIAASGPALTALLAFLLIPGSLTALSSVQIIGILIVTLAGTVLSFERMLLHNKAAKQARLRGQG
jgi:drug/metabolite transporter (DMT)-like permease/cell division protein FtsB